MMRTEGGGGVRKPAVSKKNKNRALRVSGKTDVPITPMKNNDPRGLLWAQGLLNPDGPYWYKYSLQYEKTPNLFDLALIEVCRVECAAPLASYSLGPLVSPQVVAR